MQLSVLIPVLDEQDNILPLLEELYAALAAGPAFEVLVIDDGSTDATPVRVQQVLPAYPTLRLIRHARRAGKSAALVTGAHAAQGAWLVFMDGDRQNDPADIPALIDLVQGDDDLALVNGVRHQRQDTLSKRLASRAANAIRRTLLRDDCPDTGSGLKLIRRDLFLDLPAIDCLHRFIPAFVKGRGRAYANLPVTDRPRISGLSKYTNLHRAAVGVWDLFGVMWLLRRQKRPGAATEVLAP
ncbi:glycosyl transferase [Niveispirillum lacus]|uniref:Glycosyl transferase n=1 Tax=Niveispirillum lacus TaxID=1981099 RepID=A0A255YXV9_9PROT|nr:glycosyltransferase family 2 protein [Niveispirillum lacus]OYQ33534.1 glycosyl transferase [Niveispirillum lacus]